MIGGLADDFARWHEIVNDHAVGHVGGGDSGPQIVTVGWQQTSPQVERDRHGQERQRANRVLDAALGTDRHGEPIERQMAAPIWIPWPHGQGRVSKRWYV